MNKYYNTHNLYPSSDVLKIAAAAGTGKFGIVEASEYNRRTIGNQSWPCEWFEKLLSNK